MKLLLIVLLLITPLYVRSYPVDSEHGDHHDPDNHMLEKSGEEPAESHHQHTADHEPDPDIDPLDEEMPEDFRLEELNAEEECDDNKTEGKHHNEEHAVEEKKEPKKPSLKDHAVGEHKVGKRSVGFDHGPSRRVSDRHREHPIRDKRSDSDEWIEEQRLRVRRSKESEEEKSLEHHEFHPHAERKRRDTHEQHSISKRSSSEEPHSPFKRSLGHRAPGGHEYNVKKRNTDEVAPTEAEEPEEPIFASDDIEQVDSVAIRMKRVSRAGSSHKPRVMHKNKGNSRAGQADTVVEPE